MPIMRGNPPHPVSLYQRNLDGQTHIPVADYTLRYAISELFKLFVSKTSTAISTSAVKF